MFKKLKVTTVLPLMLCGVLLGACASTQKSVGDVPSLGVNGKQQKVEITGGIYEDNVVANPPIISNDPSVAVFPLDGPIENPLTVEKYNSVLDNTTAGGYTVFDESVKVYPLPGDDVPAFVPIYSVPPLKNQYKPETPHVGELTSLAQSNLPPVPTVEIGNADPYANPPISGAVRQPLTLTSPEPLTMQPPTTARAPMLSPFADERGDVVPAEASDEHGLALPQDQHGVARAPMLTGSDEPQPLNGGTIDEPVQAAPAPGGVTAAGRKSSPMLTGY